MCSEKHLSFNSNVFGTFCSEVSNEWDLEIHIFSFLKVAEERVFFKTYCTANDICERCHPAGIHS